MTKAFTHDLDTTYRWTYRYLRWVMVAALVALFASVLIQSILTGCWLGSVSAYYYTPARTVFVGGLVAFGASLIAYKGRAPEEDVALNFAGYMAILVAIVPTGESAECPATGFGQSQEQVAAAVVNNIWSLLITTALVVALVYILRKRKDRHKVAPDPGAPVDARQEKSHVFAVILSVFCIVLLVAELWYFLANPEQFIERSHGIAAITMVFALIGVMVFNAWKVDHYGKFLDKWNYGTLYWAHAGVLTLLAVSVFALQLVVPDVLVILILELVVFGVFVSYWILQSIELWGRRTEVPSSPTPTDLPTLNEAVPSLAEETEPAR
jgi:hypothetical protein